MAPPAARRTPSLPRLSVNKGKHARTPVSPSGEDRRFVFYSSSPDIRSEVERTMSTISAAAVKALRDRTNAPMMDCKSALTEANGDMEKATELLRKRNKAI